MDTDLSGAVISIVTGKLEQKNMEHAPVPVRALEEKICRSKREL